VTGSGRSGTSTVAGTLTKLGVFLPKPVAGSDPTNPRGFFEPLWALRFNKRVLAEARVGTLDARPEALDLMAEVTSRPDLQAELKEWLYRKSRGPQLVIKDPRCFWLRDLWVGACEAVDVHPEFLTMLRHPAEVIGSRRLHYLKDSKTSLQHSRETTNVGGWVNVALTNERVSRGHQRAFAQYSDLIADWRSTMLDIGGRLELTFDADLTRAEHHPVDDFIDANLRRAKGDWDDLDVPPQLREIAQTVWQALSSLVDDPQDVKATDTMDDMREEYAALYARSLALTEDHVRARVRSERHKAVQRAREATRLRVTNQLEKKFAAELAAAAPKPSLLRRVVRRLRALRSRVR
jgi:hypothetical protein